jgi:hypothetical protein
MALCRFKRRWHWITCGIRGGLRMRSKAGLERAFLEVLLLAVLFGVLVGIPIGAVVMLAFIREMI